MNKILVAISGALFLSLPVFAQTNSSSEKPRHCSIEKSSAELPYPDSLKGSGIQGTVRLEAVVSTNGCADSVRVVRKLNPRLDKIAKETVNSWKFKPATKDGRPVKTMVEIEVRFKDPGK